MFPSCFHPLWHDPQTEKLAHMQRRSTHTCLVEVASLLLKHVLQDTHDVFSRELQIPGLPAKMHYSSPAEPAYAPRVPQPDVSGLNAVERTHVRSEQRTALGQDQQLYEVLLPHTSCIAA
jgi:hypothetical protein